jgi:hypothetical protein
MASKLSEVLAALVNFSQAELATVVATAQSLRCAPPPRPQTRQTGKGKEKKKKGGPAKPESPFKEIPEYQGFKKAEKDLRAYLKKEGKKLSEFDPANRDELPKVIADFYEVRQCWFRAKEALNQASAANAAAEVLKKDPGDPA